MARFDIDRLPQYPERFDSTRFDNVLPPEHPAYRAINDIGDAAVSSFLTSGVNRRPQDTGDTPINPTNTRLLIKSNKI